VHRKLYLALLLSLAVAVSAMLPPAVAQQKRWAAIDPNSEVSSPVVWGATEDEARQRAIDACKRLSKSCANGPAVTDDLREVFAVMCCEQPRTGCAASAAANRRDAARNVQRMFADAGYANCSVRHYFQAGTGKKQ
jgi:hypothetical protein